MNLTLTECETTDESDLADRPIVFPSPDTVTELYELALIGDINELKERVTALARSDSRLQPFAVRAQRFLKNYQMEEISEWLAPHRKKKEK